MEFTICNSILGFAIMILDTFEIQMQSLSKKNRGRDIMNKREKSFYFIIILLFIVADPILLFK